MNWAMGSLPKRASVKKLKVSSELTGIETTSPSSVTPQRHFAQTTGTFRAWLQSEQWETAPHCSCTSLWCPGVAFQRLSPCLALTAPTTTPRTQRLLRQLSAAASASSLPHCFPCGHRPWSNWDGHAPKHKRELLRGFLASHGNTQQYRRRNKGNLEIARFLLFSFIT